MVAFFAALSRPQLVSSQTEGVLPVVQFCIGLNDNPTKNYRYCTCSVIAFDEVERKPYFDLWLSSGGCPVHESTFL